MRAVFRLTFDFFILFVISASHLTSVSCGGIGPNQFCNFALVGRRDGFVIGRCFSLAFFLVCVLLLFVTYALRLMRVVAMMLSVYVVRSSE